jgi:hypothetical protein
VSIDSRSVTLIPDGFIDIRQRGTNRSLCLLIEHDRGTEQQEHFRRRIRAYMAFLASEAYKQSLSTERITVAFTTFLSAKRVAQMREWTKAEVAAEPQLASRFIFAVLPKPLEPFHLLLERRWHTLMNDQPITLLGE